MWGMWLNVVFVFIGYVICYVIFNCCSLMYVSMRVNLK